MTETITLSLNELRALLFRYFEAALTQKHDFYDAAKVVLWLEARGLGGIEMLLSTQSCSRRSGELASTTTDEPPARTIFDLKNANAICGGLAVADLTVALAKTAGVACAEIQNIKAPQILPALVADCGRQGVAAVAVSCARQSKNYACALLAPGAAEPDSLTLDDIDFISLREGAGLLICARSAEHLYEFTGAAFEACTQKQLLHLDKSASDLTAAYGASLRNGVTVRVCDYQKLCCVADTILVEASEASRRGAGD